VDELGEMLVAEVVVAAGVPEPDVATVPCGVVEVTAPSKEGRMPTPRAP